MNKIMIGFFELMLFSFVFISTSHAVDITLSGTVESGYYVTTTDITIEEDATIEDVSWVICVAEGTTTIGSGFTVEKGAVFGVFSGDPSDISETFDYDDDGTPDYWEFYNSGSIEADSTGDYDGDGLPDWYEFSEYGDVTSHDASDGSCDCE